MTRLLCAIVFILVAACSREDSQAPLIADAGDVGSDACAPRAVYRDEDEDGFGVASSKLQTCSPMQGFPRALGTQRCGRARR